MGTGPPLTLMPALKLNTLGRVGQVKAHVHGNNDRTQATALTTRSAITGITIGGMTGQDLQILLDTAVDKASTKNGKGNREHPVPQCFVW